MLTQKFNLYKNEWLDLVFNNRNKSYGAYELRYNYAGTMNKAVAITVAGFVAGALTLSVLTRHHALPVSVIEHETKLDLTRVLPPPPAIRPRPVKPVAPPQSHPSAVVIPTRVTDKSVTTEPPKLADLSKSAVGSELSKGTDVIAAPVIDGPPATSSGSGINTGDDPSAIHNFAEVAPEPNGGMAGWTKFLQKNLRYPDTESQGRVLVSFIVERDGSLTDIKIIRSISAELDREALRVIKMAPKWTPGKQGGQNVRVQFNIPINFQLQ